MLTRMELKEFDGKIVTLLISGAHTLNGTFSADGPNDHYAVKCESDTACTVWQLSAGDIVAIGANE